MTPEASEQRIQRYLHQYIPGDFEAVCDFGDTAAWERFRATLTRRGRARLTLAAQLVYSESQVASFEGEFVALK